MRNRRLMAGLLCALFVAALMASGLFVAVHAQHHCEGEHCPVCAVLCACVGLLRLTAAFTLLACAACAALHAARWWLHATRFRSFVITLVSLKVKLSN